MYTIIETPSVTPITNTIIKSSSYSQKNITKENFDNNINGKNVVKKKEKELWQTQGKIWLELGFRRNSVISQLTDFRTKIN